MAQPPSLPPGPRLPGIVQAVHWGLRYPAFTRRAHERYGPTFTVRPGSMDPLVLTTDRDAVQRLFTGDPLAKAHANDAVRPLIGDGSVMLLGPPEHLERRKLLLPPFHGERVRAYGDLLHDLVEAEVARWRPGDTITVLPVAQDLTIEVILQAILGVHDAGLRERFRSLIDAVLFHPFGTRGVRVIERLGPRLAALAGLLTPAVATYFPELKTRTRWNVATRPWWRHRDGLLELLDAQLAAARADPRLEEREDVLAMLVRARDEDGRGLSTDELQNDLIALIGAGHETTAAAIGWGAVLLAHHPEVRERATTAARDGDDAYLAALVKEVLRLRPPIPVAAGRILDEPFAIGEHTVPAGVPILIDAWNVHHDPAVHPEPERFRPERFLDGGPERYTWLPFGGGAHRCLGAALAELEIRIALTAMLRAVDLAPAGRALPPPTRRGITIVPHGGARIRIAARHAGAVSRATPAPPASRAVAPR